MEAVLAKGLVAKLEEGKIKVEYELAEAIVPAIDAVIAKIEKGEIDPIKGTDMDKELMMKVLAQIKAVLA